MDAGHGAGVNKMGRVRLCVLLYIVHDVLNRLCQLCQCCMVTRGVRLSDLPRPFSS